jgi:hypothetical protein
MNARRAAVISLLCACSPACEQSPRRETRPAASHTGAASKAMLSFEKTKIFDFVPQIAEAVATVHERDGSRTGVILALQDRDAGNCGDTTTRSMQFVSPDWTAGANVDLAHLERSDRSKSYGENAARAGTWVMKLGATPELSADSRIHPEIPWQPTGTLTLLSIPGEAGRGEVRVNLSNNGFHFDETLPIRVCVPLE